MKKTPYTPFSTPLSWNAKEVQIRFRNILKWKKARPPMLALALILCTSVLCCSMVACQIEEPPAASGPELLAVNTDAKVSLGREVKGKYATRRYPRIDIKGPYADALNEEMQKASELAANVVDSASDAQSYNYDYQVVENVLIVYLFTATQTGEMQSQCPSEIYYIDIPTGTEGNPNIILEAVGLSRDTFTEYAKKCAAEEFIQKIKNIDGDRLKKMYLNAITDYIENPQITDSGTPLFELKRAVSGKTAEVAQPFLDRDGNLWFRIQLEAIAGGSQFGVFRYDETHEFDPLLEEFLKTYQSVEEDTP